MLGEISKVQIDGGLNIKSKKTLVNNLKKKAELKNNKKWVMQTLMNGDVNVLSLTLFIKLEHD